MPLCQATYESDQLKASYHTSYTALRSESINQRVLSHTRIKPDAQACINKVKNAHTCVHIHIKSHVTHARVKLKLSNRPLGSPKIRDLNLTQACMKY